MTAELATPELATSEFDAAATRGRLTIADKAVGKVVSQAVSGHDLAAGVVRRVLGVPLGSTTDDSPARAHVRVDGALVSISLTMSVPWPQSVRQVTREVRSRIEAEVAALTGLKVVEVDIVVADLRTTRAETKRVL